MPFVFLIPRVFDQNIQYQRIRPLINQPPARRSPGRSRRKALTYFGSGYAFTILQRADSLIDSGALFGCQDVWLLGFKLREEFKQQKCYRCSEPSHQSPSTFSTFCVLRGLTPPFVL